MDFDHRDPSIKSFRLSSSRAMLAGEADLRREIAKCDVVCASYASGTGMGPRTASRTTVR
jgi:hypothetical protein